MAMRLHPVASNARTSTSRRRSIDAHLLRMIAANPSVCASKSIGYAEKVRLPQQHSERGTYLHIYDCWRDEQVLRLVESNTAVRNSCSLFTHPTDRNFPGRLQAPRLDQGIANVRVKSFASDIQRPWWTRTWLRTRYCVWLAVEVSMFVYSDIVTGASTPRAAYLSSG